MNTPYGPPVEGKDYDELTCACSACRMPKVLEELERAKMGMLAWQTAAMEACQREDKLKVVADAALAIPQYSEDGYAVPGWQDLQEALLNAGALVKVEDV